MYTVFAFNVINCVLQCRLSVNMNVIGVSRIVELCRKLDRLEVTYHDDCNTAVKILTDVSDIQVTAVMYIIVMH